MTLNCSQRDDRGRDDSEYMCEKSVCLKVAGCSVFEFILLKGDTAQRDKEDKKTVDVSENGLKLMGLCALFWVTI